MFIVTSVLQNPVQHFCTLPYSRAHAQIESPFLYAPQGNSTQNTTPPFSGDFSVVRKKLRLNFSAQHLCIIKLLGCLFVDSRRKTKIQSDLKTSKTRTIKFILRNFDFWTFTFVKKKNPAQLKQKFRHQMRCDTMLVSIFVFIQSEQLEQLKMKMFCQGEK